MCQSFENRYGASDSSLGMELSEFIPLRIVLQRSRLGVRASSVNLKS